MFPEPLPTLGPLVTTARTTVIEPFVAPVSFVGATPAPQFIPQPAPRLFFQPAPRFNLQAPAPVPTPAPTPAPGRSAILDIRLNGVIHVFERVLHKYLKAFYFVK